MCVLVIVWTQSFYILVHCMLYAHTCYVCTLMCLPAALDITVTSPLNPAILDKLCSTAGVAAVAAESHKHVANDPKCVELGWTCVPLAVETYGNWRREAQETLYCHLAASHSASKSNHQHYCIH